MYPGDFDKLILTGFMGSGKSAVGEELARRLDRPLVDMDVVIASRAGKPISQIFSDDGEVSFRALEAALCQELSEERGKQVIATGGGALVDPTNRSAMMGCGLVVCLDASLDETLRRIAEEGGRPLLQAPNPRAEANRLLASRQEAYAEIPWHIDTDGLSVGEVAGRVLSLLDTVVLPVRGLERPGNLSGEGGEYEVVIGDGLLAQVGGILRTAGVARKGRVALVSNPVVAPFYGEAVIAALRSADLNPIECIIPDGEQNKTLGTVRSLYGQFLDGGLDRSAMVVSLGGGVTGDVAGFAAASFMRGVGFAQIPTSLLAMVDASVGGKTGVDLPQGKNLVGAFKQPAVVIVDPEVLMSLPAEEYRSGLAEMIKHGVIGDLALFELLESMPEALSGAIISQAISVKVAIVERDPFERGPRAALNLGHTVGHALEKLSDFSLRHGEAVGIGMVAAANIASEMGLAPTALAARIEALLVAWKLPVRCPSIPVGEILRAMAHDKKRRGQSLRWVLPRAIGEVEIIEGVPKEVVASVLGRMGAR